MISFREYLSLTEGVDDPGILKCVFMAGGPGSGKSYAASSLFAIDPSFRSSFSSYGLKVINSDMEFERQLKLNGIPMDLEKLEKQNPAAYQHAMDIRQHAKEKTSNLRSMYERGRLGLIIDGTGRDYADIKEQYDAAHALGYDCYMVFINTTYETALARNRRRERSVKEELVSEFWQDCQKNLGKFQHLFGSANFLVVDSSDDRVKSHEVLRVMGKAIARWMSAPVKNHLGAKWIALMGGRHKH